MPDVECEAELPDCISVAHYTVSRDVKLSGLSEEEGAAASVAGFMGWDSVCRSASRLDGLNLDTYVDG